MTSRLLRATAASFLGAVAGALLLVAVYTTSPRLFIGMDVNLPAAARGFYPVERNGELTFAWTGERAEIELAGFDRRIAWSCDLILRGGRADSSTLPEVRYAVDGRVILAKTATNAFERMKIDIPARTDRRNGLHLALDVSNTFTPGPSDRRRLGVMVDAISCQPNPGHLALPRRSAIVVAAISAAIFGAAFGLVGVTAGSAIGGVALIALAQAFPLVRGLGPFASYLTWMPSLAFWIAVGMTTIVWTIEWMGGQRLRNTARFAVLFSGAMLYLKLLVLLHPDKHVGDALFHAHRLEWVLAGRYYFTQPMPDGVQFPYAIALYLFAAPWTVLTRDYVALLRVVVCTSEAAAGALLYPLIVRIWGDRLVGALAVALFSLVPLSYAIAGNANLTNAFGQSAALVTIVAATAWPLGSAQLAQLVGLTLLASLAFLSHVHTFLLLLAMLLALAFLYRSMGSQMLRAPARSVFLATMIAAVLSITSYYGQFGEVYKTLSRTRASAIARVPSPVMTQDGAETTARTDGSAAMARSLGVRSVTALASSVRAVGWSILILAIAGPWRVAADRVRDRLGLALAAWGVAYLAFLVFGALVPVEERFQRYAAEFIDRVNYATCPAVAILAARGGMWGWRAGIPQRLTTSALVIGAVGGGVQQWIGWLR